MPKNGSATLSDMLERGLDRLEVTCPKCDRRGSYKLEALIARLGPDHMLTFFLDEVTHECPRRGPHSYLDQCGAYFPALAAPPAVTSISTSKSSS